MALAGRAFADPAGPDPVASDDVPLDDALADLFEGSEASDETARSALDAGATFTLDTLAATSGLVDVTSLHELEARHRHPSPWGRLDLAITWRRVDRMTEPERSARQEILLVATWRN